MAGLPNRLVLQMAFKAGGNVFHEILAKKPNHFAKVMPNSIHDCEVHQGHFGTNGSVIQWKYTLDGKQQVCKQILQDIDEEKKQIGFKFIAGDLLELYKNMMVTFHIETKGGVDFITWTIDYELINADTPHPISLLNLYIELIKEVEAHILG